MKLFFSTPSVISISIGVALSGCQSVPQAGLVYSSNISVGVGLKVSTADATAPVDISVGYKQTDFAYVPVAVLTDRGVDQQRLEKVGATHSNANGDVRRCNEAREKVRSSMSKIGASNPSPEERAQLEAVCDFKQDAMSVFGKFDGNTTAGGNDRKVGLTVGRVFSTGVAAQNLSLAARSDSMAACIGAVKDSMGASAKPEDVSKRVDDLCGR